jgi:hypothetical protein
MQQPMMQGQMMQQPMMMPMMQPVVMNMIQQAPAQPIIINNNNNHVSTGESGANAQRQKAADRKDPVVAHLNVSTTVTARGAASLGPFKFSHGTWKMQAPGDAIVHDFVRGAAAENELERTVAAAVAAELGAGVGSVKLTQIELTVTQHGAIIRGRDPMAVLLDPSSRGATQMAVADVAFSCDLYEAVVDLNVLVDVTDTRTAIRLRTIDMPPRSELLTVKTAISDLDTVDDVVRRVRAAARIDDVAVTAAELDAASVSFVRYTVTSDAYARLMEESAKRASAAAVFWSASARGSGCIRFHYDAPWAALSADSNRSTCCVVM